jgi:hypothetical protein
VIRVTDIRPDTKIVNSKLQASEHRYRIRPANPGAHLYEVAVQVQTPDRAGQIFRLPAWIPGSYLIRDYAKHVVSIRAESQGHEIRLEKIDKSSWLADPVEAPLNLLLEVYAYDSGVRSAHLDTTHAYFNGTCVFPEVVGQENRPCELVIEAPPDGIGADWRVATSMRARDARKYGYGSYAAENYAELIDHPVEIGQLQIGEFDAGGIPHTIAIRGTRESTLQESATICRRWRSTCISRTAEKSGPLCVPADAARGRLRWAGAPLFVEPGLRPVRPSRARREHSQGGIPKISRSLQSRVFPFVARQAHQAGGFHALRSEKETYTGLCGFSRE